MCLDRHHAEAIHSADAAVIGRVGSPRQHRAAALSPAVVIAAFASLFSCSCVANPSPPSTPKADTGTDLIAEIDQIVLESFYSPQLLQRIDWSTRVTSAAAAWARAADGDSRTLVIRDLLATLQTSHTEYYPRDDPAYWEMASIFEPFLRRSCAKERAPAFPVTREGIGVLWKNIEGRWFVAGVFARGPARDADLQVGDEVVSARGQPFSPVLTFAGKAGKPVSLEIRRQQGAPAFSVLVTPETEKPHDRLRQATADSWRMIDRGGKKIAYVRVWSWTSIEIHQAVMGSILKSNAAGAEGFIIDLRDGWGGANPHYLGLFFRDPPVLEAIDRDGKSEPFDSQIRKPAVILVNGGTRSGKEAIAYGAQKHGLAQLVGERTAGAVVFGQPFCLSNGSLLYLAAMDARLDGTRLEGNGVSPDIEVPFDFRYSAGRDPQLERALEALASGS